MYSYTYEKNNNYVVLPMIPLRGLVPYPGIQLNAELIRKPSLAGFSEAATVADAKVILLTQKEISEEEPNEDGFFGVGVVASVKHVVKNTKSHISVVFEGIERVKITDVHWINPAEFFIAEAQKPLPRAEKLDTPEINTMMMDVKKHLDALMGLHPGMTQELKDSALAVTEPGAFADFVSSIALIDYKNKQSVLDALTVKKRLERLLVGLSEEYILLECEKNIQEKVKEKIDESQKTFFLREQIKAIQNELGEDEGDDEIVEYEEKIRATAAPDDVKDKMMKELGRMAKTPFGSAEATVLRTYLDVLIEFPFGKRTEVLPTVEEAAKILDRDHDGLTKVKERILEYVAVKQISPDVKNQILCLVGPPGVGKTSVAASVAEALKRKYARVSLGGMHDEAEIRGHRKTYVGAMPGRIINAINESGVMNPVIVLDEIDKMDSSIKGDPTAALLEVLDPEQNKYFRDNFMEIPVDLSDVVFIATANSYDGIPAPLIDRMEVIELQTYTDTEKLNIAKNHLLPKQLKRHGLTKRQFRISDDALLALMKGYTREAGVRNLEREIASLIRKAAKMICDGKAAGVSVTKKNLTDFLGKIKVLPETLEKTDSVGIVNGLAYTQAGGDLLKVEVAVMEGSGKIELTGSLGDVMKESAKIAHSYVRTVAERYGIDKDFYKNRDLHIHFPEGAIPKDGPSAGVTMVTAMVSALSGTPVRRDVAMTGEISLLGKVLPIGGLREKTLAAYRAGVTTVIIPEDNLRDLDEIDTEARNHLHFITARVADDVLSAALSRS